MRMAPQALIFEVWDNELQCGLEAVMYLRGLGAPLGCESGKCTALYCD